jgi:mucin-19
MKTPNERSLLSLLATIKKSVSDIVSAAVFARATGVVIALASTSFLANAAQPIAANALPTGGQVVAGNVAISQTQNATSATMNINQTSQRAIVNWDSFNVGKNATVNFNQPNASAVILNRVTSATPSMINGAVNANGQVVLVNPNGVTFGRGADINAAGVVASTMDIANKDFMNGKSTFNGNSKGAIVNEGRITTNTDGGYIALLAPEVRNQGYLLAMRGAGTVAIGAGEQITLDFKGNALISLKVDKSTYQSLIENKHVVETSGGLVVMAAGAANQLMGSVIKNTGRIAANSMVNNGGVIELVAAKVTQAGTVAANSQGAQGGQINLVGNDITLAKDSKTTAIGTQGGGQVNVGLAASQVSGGTQINAIQPSQLTNSQAESEIKANAALAFNNKQMAKTVTVEQGALVDTSATQTGNGGTIAIWSEIKTIVAGSLKATGGMQSGNGGFIETSSKGAVELVKGFVVNTSAALGKLGTWLLDPIDLVINAGAAHVISAALENNNVTIEVNGNVCPSLGSCTQNGSGSLTIASGADILKAGTNASTLRLISSGIFNLNANISGENLNVIINSSIAYLNVGTSITASQVTVQAQTIHVNGNITAISNSPLNAAIQLLAQALYISGRLSTATTLSNNNSNTNTNTNNTVTYNGTLIRAEDLPAFLRAQNNSNTNLDQVYSSTAANDNSASNINTQTNSIYLQAANDITLYSTAQIKANGTTGGYVNITAQTLNAQSGSLIQANGNNGPGGVINISAVNDMHIQGARIEASGSSNGGSITMITTHGDLTLNGSTIQTNGSNGRGGSIGISARDLLDIQASTIESIGHTHGGTLLIGNDAKYGTLPFALYAAIDQYSALSAHQRDPAAGNHNGGFIETSGQTLSMMASINAGRGGMWLIDPTNITISTSSSTGGNLNAAIGQAGVTNINATDLQNAINGGTSITIIGSGTITQTANLSFAPASGVNVSLTYDNRTGTAQSITLTGTTTNTGAGNLTLNYLSSGQVIVNGAINSTSTGRINVLAQSFYASNTSTSGTGANISIANNITTKGGFIALDGTGGSISSTGVITKGPINNGTVTLLGSGVVFNTTTTGVTTVTAATTGGNLAVTTSQTLAPNFGPYGAWYIGGYVDINSTSSGTAQWGFVFNSYLTTFPIAAVGDINITVNNTSSSITSGRGVIDITSSLRSFAGAVNLSATTTGSAIAVNSSAAITAANGINIIGTSGAAATVVSLSSSIITNAAGNITITGNNSAAGGSTGISSSGAITQNANGGNITFTSNNIINQAGAITLAANTSANAANIIYNTTAGSSSSNVTTGALTITSGSTSPINYTIQTAGSAINPGTIGTTASPLPGFILLDNTFGCTTAPCTRASGFINTTAGNHVTLATASTGITINTAVVATGNITMNGVTSTSNHGIYYPAAITSTNGSAVLNGGTASGIGVYAGAALTANNITITGTKSTAGGNAPAYLDILRINSGAVGGSITVTGNVTASPNLGTANGIYQAGAITGASGSNISFISNNSISQNGAITLAANTSPNAANITYNTTTGTKGSSVVAGALTIASGSTAAINYTIQTAGASINPGTIGTVGVSLPGFVLLDNTFGGAGGTNGAPLSGFINTTTGNLAALATASTGITINAAVFTTGNVSLIGVTNGANQGIAYSATITSSNGSVVLNGGTVSGLGVYGTVGIVANNITITGTATTTGVNYASYIEALRVNIAGGNISIVGNVIGNPGASGGIYQSGAITLLSGSNLSLVSNNDISQNGAIGIAANISSSAVNITYNTTTGTKGSSVVAGALTIASGSTAAINYTIQTAGGSINPGTIGTVSVALPGSVLLDNTFGGNAGANGAPLSGFINTTTGNLAALATASTGITINNALFATGNITMNGVTNGGNDGIIYTAGITSTNGAVVLNGGTVSGLGVFTNTASLIRGNTITITGTATQAPNWAVYVNALTINSGSVGGSISVTGNVINLPGATGGIYQAGAITLASGSNLSFVSNNNIDQNGLITIPANLSGTAANITYNTTSGDRTSSIGTGALSITAGSTANINYSVLSSGSSIAIGGAVVVPGSITLDNTYGCAASTPACTPATGYINNNLANWTALAVASTGISVGSSATMSGTAVTINAVNSNVNSTFQFFSPITATTGDITINALSTAGWVVTNGQSGVGWLDGSLTANNGAIRINATATTTGIGVFLHGTGTMGRLSARAISIESFSSSGTYAAYLAEMRIAAGGTNINITGTVGDTSTTGIYQSGPIVSSAAGSNISFITNGKINQLGAISLVSNATSTAVSITYNTTSGDKNSSITTGALTVAAGTNTTPINFVAKSSGSAINPGAIGTSTVNLPGYILIDNTYGCATAPCTPITGFINTTTNNLAALATASIGVTINAAIFASGNISLIGVTNGTNRGIEYSAVITSTNDSVILNGGTVSGIGVYGTAGVVANNITILGTASSTAVNYASYVEALRINSGSVGGSITVTGNVIGNPGAYGGIYQSGAILGANGSNIRFISNNNISQNGAITLVANTSGVAANVLYDLTTGIKTSSILTTGTLAIPAGSNSPINYTIQTAGAAINPGTIGTALLPLPGFILLDNTFGCTGLGCTPLSGFINTTTGNHTSLASASTGITINTAVVATGNITMNGVTSTSNHGIYYPAAITSLNGVAVLNGGTATGIGVYGTAALTANNITITGTKSTAGGNAPSYIDILRINSGAVDGNITVTGNVTASPNLGTANGIYQSGAITGISGSNISFISNNSINQVGAISLAANISGRTANITYNTTAGSSGSNVTTGVLTIVSGSTSPINYTIQTAGSAINPGTIGTTASPLPGAMLLDNTFGCTASTPACTPVTGFINTTTGNHTTLATASNGILINTAIVATGNITMNGVTSTTNHGIYYPAAITSTAGSVVLNGGTASGIGVYGGVALTANNITITGTGTTTSVNYASYLDILQINSGFVGGNITVTGNVIGRPGASGGIYQAGAITLNSGSNLSFISNNDISQNGTISVAANVSGTATNIIYNTTSGNNASQVTAGIVSLGAGTNNAAINYQVRTNGATISVPAITVPGFILLDNSCLGCNTPVTTSTAATNGAAITITGALSAGSLAGSTGVTINAVANGTGIGFTQGANAISSTAGGITITVNGQTGTGYSSSGNLTATGQAITVSTTTANITTTSAGAGISTSGLISGGAVTLVATQSATATLVPITATGTITANSLTVTGTGGVSTTVVSLGTITINAGGGNITITGNNAAAGTNTGITQTGTITNNAVGSNISFISNNDITQGGTITLVANTGTPAANIIYNTTAGNSTSLITTGTLSVGAGTNNAAINYQVRTNGATISVPAITVPGYILLDNSCLGCNTPVTTSTAATNGAAITITGALSAGSLAGSTGVTINAVANGTGIGFTQGANAISSTAGGITITVNGQTGTGYSSSGNLTATGQAITVSTTTADITTTSAGAGISTSGLISGGAVTLLATQSATATTTTITATGTITANSLTVTGTGGVSTTVVSLGTITINAGGGNITITGNNAAAGTNTGITQTGTITNNAVGSNISFISNNDITQGGTITLVANTGTPAANIIYNTTAGNSTSLITTGTLSVGAGTNNAAINYQVRTNGATISVPAITVPGYILLDNSCLGCNTPVTTSTAATNGAAITITGALSAGSLAGSTGVTINAVANGTGIGFTQGANAISSTAGGITITVNGQTGTGYSSSGNLTATGQAITVSTTTADITTTSAGAGISTSGLISGGAVTLLATQSATATTTTITATGTITANSLTVTGTGGVSTTVVSLGTITINAGGGNITITGNNAAAGTNTGITQTGTITNNAVGSNISFISNNKINQTGAIALAANTGAAAALVLYDTTNGNKDGSIVGGALTVTTGANSVINYIARSAGSAIAMGAIGTSSVRLPGTVTLDNTFGCATAPCTRVSGFITTANASTLATSSAGVTVANAIHSTGTILIKGISSSGAGVTYSAALNSSLGGITIAGTSVGAASTSYGIHGSNGAGIVSAADTTNGFISFSGTSTLANLASDGIRIVASATITAGAGVNLYADGFSGNIITAALITNSGTTSGVTVNAYGNVSTAGITNSGANGIRIIAGRGIPAGTTAGGTITAVGTLTNTRGVIGISMAAAWCIKWRYYFGSAWLWYDHHCRCHQKYLVWHHRRHSCDRSWICWR